MEDIQLIQTFLAVCGGISIVGGAAAVIYKVFLPMLNLNKRVENLEHISEEELESLCENREMNQVLCKSMLALLNHSIDGNGIESMKEVRSELQEMIIKR